MALSVTISGISNQSKYEKAISQRALRIWDLAQVSHIVCAIRSLNSRGIPFTLYGD